MYEKSKRVTLIGTAVTLDALINFMRRLDENNVHIYFVGSRFYRSAKQYTFMLILDVGAQSPKQLTMIGEKEEGIKVDLVSEKAVKTSYIYSLKELQSKYGVAGKVISFHIGFNAGDFISRVLSKEGFTGRDLLEAALKIFEANGLGKPEIILFKSLLTKSCRIRIYESIECTREKTGECEGNMFRGYLTAVLRRLWNSEVTVVEEKCSSKGDEFCEFYATA
ncbi:MAG: 4-vinyl reductase [Thermoproteales archaeon]|nr:4-vinyl reductase [Thermoproteales archaeon]